jgi:hypothetical protein
LVNIVCSYSILYNSRGDKGLCKGVFNMDSMEKIKIEQKGKEKIFLKNDDALKYCNALRKRGKKPYKYVIVTWDE